MRWWCLPILAALAWFAYTLTPLWALYDLAGAVQRGDAEYIERHVNFRTLRVSLARQATAAIRARSDPGEGRDRAQLADAAGALAVPLADALVTPATVIDLLANGWPRTLATAGGDLPETLDPPGAEGASSLPRDGLRIPTLGRLAGYYGASDMRGFRAVVVRVPPDRPRGEQFVLRLRLRGFSWRLVDIEMTEALRARIGERLARAGRRLGGDRREPAAPPSEVTEGAKP